ncbi:MAG: sulfatase [Bacteroidia bacterium]|nr:sulfatase [Bacteroidia bacterium]
MNFWFGLIYFFLMGMLAACSAPKQHSPEKIRNIVFIIGDDHAAYALGAYGNRDIRTPNLDRLANAGVRFSRAYANAPLCSASRQSLLTGRYPHATGVTLLRTPLPDSQVTVAEHLKPFGYHTAAIGKMHFNNNLSHGFDTLIERKAYQNYLTANPPAKVPDSIAVRPPWRPFRDPARIWLNSEVLPSEYLDKDDIGTFYAEAAGRFMEENQNNPFCLWVGFNEPHSPFNFPVEFRNKYKARDMKLPQGTEEDDRWIPQVFADLTDEEKKGIIASYYTSVEYLDKNVGLILDKIESLGLVRNTMIVYVGDHGYLLNHHKRFEKHTMWEPAVHTPMLVCAPGHFPSGIVVESLVELVDLVPTLTEALGLTAMETTQGKNLMPLIMQQNFVHKDYVFSEFLADNKAMVRTSEWKYIFSTGKRDMAQGYATGNPPPGITHQLYDLSTDPDETTNLATDPEYRGIVGEMQNIMISHFRQTHPNASRIPESPSAEEQLMAFCEPPEGDEDPNTR